MIQNSKKYKSVQRIFIFFNLNKKTKIKKQIIKLEIYTLNEIDILLRILSIINILNQFCAKIFKIGCNKKFQKI